MKTILLLAPLLLAAAFPAAAQTGGTETRAQAEARAAALFARIDADGDGVVTRDEMAAFAAARSGQTAIPGAPLPPAAQAMFDDADADHDGTITRAEAIAGALRGFDAADTDHDGKVTPEERAAATRRVAADLPGGSGASASGAREVAGPPRPDPEP